MKDFRAKHPPAEQLQTHNEENHSPYLRISSLHQHKLNEAITCDGKMSLRNLERYSRRLILFM